MKKITAVLPSIGRITYLDIAIASALNQTRSFDEIIVFDNSEEQRLNEWSKFGADNKVKFVKSGGGLNAIDSWNTAVRKSTCEYVTIIGDDDFLFSNYCENVYRLICDSDVGILKAYSFDENGVKKNRLTYPKQNVLSDKEFRNLRYLKKISLFVPGIVFKKQLFCEVGGFKDTYINGSAYSDELLLSQLSALVRNIALSDEYCWGYRVHTGQLGGVRDISGYVSKVLKYVSLYERSMGLIGVRGEALYPGFTKKDYIGKACGYGVILNAVYLGKNNNVHKFLLSLIKYFVLDTRVSRKNRRKITWLSIKAFIGATKQGQQLKRIRSKLSVLKYMGTPYVLI